MLYTWNYIFIVMYGHNIILCIFINLENYTCTIRRKFSRDENFTNFMGENQLCKTLIVNMVLLVGKHAVLYN